MKFREQQEPGNQEKRGWATKRGRENRVEEEDKGEE